MGKDDQTKGEHLAKQGDSQNQHQGYLLLPKIYFSLLIMVSGNMNRRIIILILISYQVVVSSLSWTHDWVTLSLTARELLVLIEIDIENMSILKYQPKPTVY